ncbi:hypothetical protein LX15_001520 [Streptoalloteichus tenebrarius]|uniref:Uncharacterized protein n=1 Tax=Streptoalloteichus tenebrarius (strain ATCC 17920 / DSM 40477 / JCM 4838 / CBS 697.72 / NBRC 16177 / NCIMB 11028 / NRRL B-12390 / A12253. 1 / ISP 5477) TaxID=1933 RepID=A0ABT1HQP2_STRSD|nr:hypothetical protein [Streptoalloteichus tenebrarius]MCP2257834.1 hypothetical protein [Streptoalloteichus tenebrarius]
MDLDHWHRIEYWQIKRGQRVLVHAEEINDHGFYIGRTIQRQMRTTATDYTRALFEEFLLKHGSQPGQRWLVRVWRLTGRSGAKTVRVCDVPLTIPSEPAVEPAAESAPTGAPALV